VVKEKTTQLRCTISPKGLLRQVKTVWVIMKFANFAEVCLFSSASGPPSVSGELPDQQDEGKVFATANI
jgi:hypothetical protein